MRIAASGAFLFLGTQVNGAEMEQWLYAWNVEKGCRVCTMSFGLGFVLTGGRNAWTAVGSRAWAYFT